MEKIATDIARSTPNKTQSKFSFPKNCEDKLRIWMQQTTVKATTTIITSTTAAISYILVIVEAKI